MRIIDTFHAVAEINLGEDREYTIIGKKLTPELEEFFRDKIGPGEAAVVISRDVYLSMFDLGGSSEVLVLRSCTLPE